MYLLGTQVEIKWILNKTPNIILLSDLSIITVQPDGSTNFIPAVNFVEPSSTEKGLVTHFITPDATGLWNVTLVKGDAETYVPLSKTVLYVFDNVTIVTPLSYNPNSLDLIGA